MHKRKTQFNFNFLQRDSHAGFKLVVFGVVLMFYLFNATQTEILRL